MASSIRSKEKYLKRFAYCKIRYGNLNISRIYFLIEIGRIESYEYTNPQLYLSTIFFTALLFLLPTNLVYYVVFASVSFIIYDIILMKKKCFDH